MPAKRKAPVGKCPKGCAYSGEVAATPYCRYFLVTGERRPCPPGKDCKVYRKGRQLAIPREDLWEV